MKATGKNQPERERERKIAELADLIRDTYPDLSPEQAEDLARKAAMTPQSTSRLNEARQALFGVTPE